MPMYSCKSYKLTKAEYSYLLPVLKKHLLNTGRGYYFCGDMDALDDMLSRLKGLYDHFDEYNPFINYLCFEGASLQPFREKLTRNKQ